MASASERYEARVVVTGVDEQGRGRIVSDGPGSVRFPSPIDSSTAVWEATRVPVERDDLTGPDAKRYLPPPDGVRVFLSAFAPDSDWDADPSIAANAVKAAGLDPGGDRPPGFHQTPTVDVNTVISGEIVVVLDEGEVLLRQGDTIIQHGPPHRWSNRTSETALVLAVMVSTTDAAGGATS